MSANQNDEMPSVEISEVDADLYQSLVDRLSSTVEEGTRPRLGRTTQDLQRPLSEP